MTPADIRAPDQAAALRPAAPLRDDRNGGTAGFGPESAAFAFPHFIRI